MGYLNKILAIVQILIAIDRSTESIIKLESRVDTKCNDPQRREYIQRASNSLHSLYRQAHSVGRIHDCCCSGVHITCYLSYNGIFRELESYSDCLSNDTDARSGNGLVNFGVTEVVTTDTCTGILVNSAPASTTTTPQRTNCTGGQHATTTTLSGGKNAMHAKQQASTSDNDKLIGGVVGGVLGALAALAPLAYFMYRKLKKSSQVDDVNNSTANLFGASPIVDIGDAPNSVPPAGTG